jgi:hypothetical protein
MLDTNVITTITTPAGSFALTTLDTVKSVLGISGSTDDSYLTLAIGQASGLIANYCNRVFALETVQDAIRPSIDTYPWNVPGGLSPVQLTRWPVTTITSVTEDGTTLTAGTGYEVDKARGQLWRLDMNGNLMAWRTVRIVVAYAGGYVLPPSGSRTLPVDLEMATIDMVKAQYMARSRDPLLKGEAVPGVYSAQYDLSSNAGSGLPDSVVGMIDNYRVPVAA